jgi:hypothetical protein
MKFLSRSRLTNQMAKYREAETYGELILNNLNNHPEISLMQVAAENWHYHAWRILDILLINLPSKYNNIRLKILLFALLKYNYRSRLAVDPDSFYSIRSAGI